MRDSRLLRYYAHQRAQDNGPLIATVNLPVNLSRYVSRLQSKTGSEIDGYRRYEVPLLASYSRSGTNWLRYTIEWISGQPTPGQVRLMYGSDYVVDRAHHASVVMDRYSKVILVVRDYRECLIRHHTALWRDTLDVASFLEATDVYQPPSWYIENIAAFDAFDGPKLLVYYEDLVGEPEKPIRELSQFIGFDRGRTEEFITTLEERKAASLVAYQRRDHTSETNGSADFGHHAKKNLSSVQAAEFDEYYRISYPELFALYLERYALTK